jgi:hypothetical protein
MYTEWLAMEHYRMHLIETWPDGARKQASLASARAAIMGLERIAPAEASGFCCGVCTGRSRDLPVADLTDNVRGGGDSQPDVT